MNTTIIGLLAATASAIQTTIQQGHSLYDWKTWIMPVALSIFGYLSKDAGPSKR